MLYFASGYGLVAIAAAKVHAARVVASEIDELALVAIEMNDRESEVAVETRAGDLVGRDEGSDVALAGDISYSRETVEPATNWLETLASRGATTLIGDPGRAHLARVRLEQIAEYRVPVTRDLKDSDMKRSAVFWFRVARS